MEKLLDEFLKAALVPRDRGHGSGTLDEAESILSAHPEVRGASIATAAALGEEAAVRAALAADTSLVSAPLGPYGWDALTHLCFSRYLRLQTVREAEFVRTARALLEAGASANTGWYETTEDGGTVKREFESVLYGAAGVARSIGLTRLLLEFGGDPNDGETPYHAPETYENAIVQVLLESGRLTPDSKVVMLVRKADWHDQDGMRLLLEHQTDPNRLSWIGVSGLQHAVRRDNSVDAIELLLAFGADPTLANSRDGRSGVVLAARRGRGDLLRLFERSGFAAGLEGVDRLIAVCATGDNAAVRKLIAAEPELANSLRAENGALLAEFGATGNAAGVKCLLELGVPVNQRYVQTDGYLGIAKETTALRVAAWRAWPAVVEELLAHGAAVNARDGDGTTALVLAVRACVNSYWMERRSPDTVAALLAAGAVLDGVPFPCGYDEVDLLLAAAKAKAKGKDGSIAQRQ